MAELPEVLGPLLREARARLAAASVDEPALDARLIVEHFSGTNRTQAIAESLGARCVVENSKCIAAVRNAAVRGTRANAVVTIDADSWMQPHTVGKVMAKVHDPRFIGGGAAMWPER